MLNKVSYQPKLGRLMNAFFLLRLHDTQDELIYALNAAGYPHN